MPVLVYLTTGRIVNASRVLAFGRAQTQRLLRTPARNA